GALPPARVVTFLVSEALLSRQGLPPSRHGPTAAGRDPRALARRDRRAGHAVLPRRGKSGWEGALLCVRQRLGHRGPLRVPAGRLMTSSANMALHGAVRFRLPTRSWRAILLRSVLVCLAPLAHSCLRVSAAEFKPLEPLAETKSGRIEKFVAADAFKIGNR